MDSPSFELTKTIISVPIKILEAKASDDFYAHDMDVMNIKFDLVYEGVNNNGDRFTEAEIRGAYKSLVHKFVDWEHDEPIIGVITDSSLVEETGKPLGISCEATIWSMQYPEFADQIRQSAELASMGMESSASLGMSMECYFHDADYVIGDYEQVIPQSQDTGELAFLKGKTLAGKLVSRELKGIVFGGAGCTANPAEKRARLKAVARNESVITGKELFANLADADFALSSMRMFPINTNERVSASLNYFESVASGLKESITPAQILEAHNRLITSAKERGIDISSHVCSFCKENKSEVKDSTSEGGIDNMENPKIEEEVVPEEKVEEKVAEAEVLEEETPSEDEPESPEAIAEEFDSRSVLTEILETLKSLVPAKEEEVVASEDEPEDELTKALKQVEDLKAQLKDVASEKEKVEANHRGYVRLQEITKLGLEVPKEKADEKQSFLAGMSDEAYASYKDDMHKIASAAKVDTIEEPELEEAAASLVLEDEKTDPVNMYEKFARSAEIY